MRQVPDERGDDRIELTPDQHLAEHAAQEPGDPQSAHQDEQGAQDL